MALQIDMRDVELDRAAELLSVARRRAAVHAAALAQLKQDAMTIIRLQRLYDAPEAVQAMASAVDMADALTTPPPPPWSPRAEGLTGGDGRPGSSTDALTEPPPPPRPAPPQ